MPRLTCPYCGAELEAPEGVSHVVCPYCGTVVELDTGSRAPTFIYPARLEERDVEAFLAARLPLLPGADPRVSEAEVLETQLHYIPLFNIRVSAEACEAARAVREAALEATRDLPPGFPGDYAYPVVGRAPYNPDTRRKAVFHQVGYDWRSHPKLAALVAEAESEAARESLAYCRGSPVRTETKLLGVSHYPVWLTVYQHRGRSYTALVDAVEARIVYAEYPVGGKGRATLLASAAGASAASTAASLAVAAATHSLAALIGAPIAVAAAAYLLAKALRRKLSYRASTRVYTRPVGRLA